MTEPVSEEAVGETKWHWSKRDQYDDDGYWWLTHNDKLALEEELKQLRAIAGLADDARATMHKYLSLFPENERRVWAARYDAIKAQEQVE